MEHRSTTHWFCCISHAFEIYLQHLAFFALVVSRWPSATPGEYSVAWQADLAAESGRL